MHRLTGIIGLLLAIFLLVFGLQFGDQTVSAAGETISGSTEFTGVKNTPIAIDDIEISGSGNPTVPVRLFVTNGSLSMSTTTGLSFDGPSSGSQIEFSGSLTNINNALATLTYTRVTAGSDTLEMSLVDAGEVFFPGNGHLYEYISSTLTWNNAKTAAQALTKYGSTGYLTTITSQAENDFVADRLENAGWMGASDSNSESHWTWAVGPEIGTQFWLGNFNGGPTLGRYANWNTGEPNDSSSNEDCGQFLSGGNGKWNDLPCNGTTLPGYVVEYGADGDLPTVASHEATITTSSSPNNPTSLGGSEDINGDWMASSTPLVEFSLTDSDVSDELRYRIQFDNDSDFSSPVIDYQSGPKSQGSFNFLVGQAEGEGTNEVGDYIVGGEDQTLADGQYYWRVKSIDDSGYETSYVTANGGDVAFGVDTTAPTMPGTPSTVTPTNDTTPTLTWTASSDSASGLHPTVPYIVYRSASSGFDTSYLSNASTNSFTPDDPLGEGTWYFRTIARDSLNNQTGFSETFAITVDITSPSLDSVSPEDDSQDVLRNQNLTMSFAEDVFADSGYIKIYQSSDNSLVESLDVTSDTVSVNNNIVTVNLDTTLDFNTEYYIQIDNTAFDDQAGNGFAGIADTTSWNFTTESTDVDNDGISSLTEDASPNDGDANNDGIADSLQANVSSFVNNITGNYVVLELDEACSITSISIGEENTNWAKDEDFSYPKGMLDFTADCGENGFTTSVRLTYFGEEKSDFLARKFDPKSGEYATINSANIEFEDTDSIVISYSVTDGSKLDTDGQKDGTIKDPVGLAVNIGNDEGSLSPTGNSETIVIYLGLVLVVFSLISLTGYKLIRN